MRCAKISHKMLRSASEIRKMHSLKKKGKKLKKKNKATALSLRNEKLSTKFFIHKPLGAKTSISGTMQS